MKIYLILVYICFNVKKEKQAPHRLQFCDIIVKSYESARISTQYVYNAASNSTCGGYLVRSILPFVFVSNIPDNTSFHSPRVEITSLPAIMYTTRNTWGFVAPGKDTGAHIESIPRNARRTELGEV